MSTTDRHPDEGVLRRLLDEPAGVADPDRRHVADCTACLTALAAVRADAETVGAALSASVETDTDAAWHRLTTAATRSAAVSPPTRSRSLVRRPAAAVLAFAVVLTGAGTAAANDWLPIFRTEQIATVTISPDSLVALPDLEAYGDLVVAKEPELREVPDAAAAAAATGLDVPAVNGLPRGISGTPTYQVADQVTATFTFSADEAARATGAPPPPPPPGLAGSAVRLTAGPGVAQLWASDAGTSGLVVGRAVAPTAASSGVPFEVVRDYLLSLPGLPPELAGQLRTFTADGSTLPLPVPADLVTTTSADVGGVPATVLETRDRALAAVVWVDAGVVTLVAGSLDADEVLAVARELQ